jgi:outer membrane protein TolC
MKRKLIVSIATVVALIVFSGGMLARADFEGIDRIIDRLDALKPPRMIVLTLDDCIAIAMENNHELLEKQFILNSVQGDEMIDKSRFFSHVDVMGSFSRSEGTLLKTYYPSYNPQVVASLGSIDTRPSTSSTTSTGSTDLASLAAQYGISDISSLMSMVPSQYQSVLTGLMGGQGANASTLNSAGKVTAQQITDINLDELAEMLQQLQDTMDYFNSLVSSASERSSSDSELAIRYSRRILEWGRDSSSSVQIRKNRRLAIYNYQQKLREVVTNVRTTFFLILLKKEQIETRQKLLQEYEEKLWKLNKRFEVAKDVQRIDVLTAELDVLNEEDRINSLKSELMQDKLDLLNVLNLSLGVDVDFVGEISTFDYTPDDVVRLTKENSFYMTYLREEYDESEQQFKQLAWDYKPILSGKIGIENQPMALGLSLNNSDQTYGLDLGVAGYTNVPAGSSSSSSKENNYSLSLGVQWNLYDNMERGGVTKKNLEKLNETHEELKAEESQEELDARKAYQKLLEAAESLKIARDIVENSKKRLEITRKLREYGKVNEFQLDSLRNTFFSDQENYFSAQENLIKAQEDIRGLMGIFF